MHDVNEIIVKYPRLIRYLKSHLLTGAAAAQLVAEAKKSLVKRRGRKNTTAIRKIKLLLKLRPRLIKATVANPSSAENLQSKPQSNLRPKPQHKPVVTTSYLEQEQPIVEFKIPTLEDFKVVCDQEPYRDLGSEPQPWID